MIFYDKNSQEINKNEWIDEFQPFYYLDGPTHGKRITIANQSSEFIEKKIEKILKDGLQIKDFPLIIAWKIGAINHSASEYQRAIIFKNNFSLSFLFKTHFYQINSKDIINYCQENFDNLINNNENTDIEKLLKSLLKKSGQGIGIVCCISLIFFLTRGRWPIYDKYANIALDAILSNKKPGESVRYRQINSWRDYYEIYIKNITEIFGIQNIPRDIDRSLWVYGHFYKSN
ncbi:MAG: hypothetical protein WCV41_02145 [Patescibacteria group bacterium]